MTETIAEAVAGLRGGAPLGSLDEASTKQGIVLRLLSLAGWNPVDLSEIVHECTFGGRRVDYALRLGSVNRVFIEVKRPNENLEQHQQQLLDYCFQEGVRLATLTNGRTWWFYLPLREGSWEQRRFFTIDLESQEPETVQSRFLQFLSRENVASGKAVDTAEQLIYSHQRNETLRDTMVQAWNEIIDTPNDLLVDLISEEIERICGFKPDGERVEQFLARHLSRLHLTTATTPPVAPVQAPVATRRPAVTQATPQGSPRRGYAGSKPSSFTFQGQRRDVTAWLDVLKVLCEIIPGLRGQEFVKVLELRGRRRPYFSRDGSELRAPLLLDFSGIFVESNLSANQIVKLSNDISKLLGFPEEALDIRTG